MLPSESPSNLTESRTLASVKRCDQKRVTTTYLTSFLSTFPPPRAINQAFARQSFACTYYPPPPPPKTQASIETITLAHCYILMIHYRRVESHELIPIAFIHFCPIFFSGAHPSYFLLLPPSDRPLASSSPLLDFLSFFLSLRFVGD